MTIEPGLGEQGGAGTAAICFHQALKEPGTEDQNILTAVQRFSKSEQFHGVAQGGDQHGDGGVKAHRRINRERNRLAFNKCPQRSIFGGKTGNGESPNRR